MSTRLFRALSVPAILAAVVACSSDEDGHGHSHEDGGHQGGHGGEAGGTSGGAGGSGNATSGGGGGMGGMSMGGGGMGGMNMGGMGGMHMDGGMTCMGADTYAAGMKKTGTTFDVELVMSMPAPTSQGDHDWTIRVLEAGTSTAVSGATIDSTPFMAMHGHGTPSQETVTDNGDGTYLLSPVNFLMAGLWDVTISVTSGGTTEELIFSFCIGGAMDMDGGMHMDMDGGMGMDGSMNMDGGMSMDAATD